MPVCPDTLPLREARDRYLAANGFSLQGYTAPTFTIGFWGLPVKLPNPAERQRVIPFHDLHHVLTGYHTDWVGEAEIGAWELRAGCKSWVAYALNACAVAIGLLIAPTRVWRAARAAQGQHTLYRDSFGYDSLLQMTVGEVRKRLGIPPDGLASPTYVRQSSAQPK